MTIEYVRNIFWQRHLVFCLWGIVLYGSGMLYSHTKVQATQSDSTVSSVVTKKIIGSSGDAVCLSAGYSGEIFVVKGKKLIVYQFDPVEKEEKLIGGAGWGDYEFDTPTDVCSSFLLEVYVTDRNNRRIQKYDKDLNYIQTYNEQTISKLEGRFYPLACATSSRGDLFVIETDGVRILKINKRNQVESEFGTYRDGAGKLFDPKDITISSADEIFVLDNASVKVFDLYGNYVRSIPLSNTEQWKNIHVSGQVLIVTSSHFIKFIQLDSSSDSQIEKVSVEGFDELEDFQDAAISNDHLYILTATALYRCTLP
jgi:hypothetical protein